MTLRGSFTVNINKILIAERLTQEDLAFRTYLPLWYIQKICDGSVNPSIYEVLLISDVLSTPIEKLFWLDD